MATANTTPEIQAQIDALKEQVARLTAIAMPEVVINEPTDAGGGYLPNPTQADIVEQINASFAVAANAVQSSTTALANTVSHLLENPILEGNTIVTANTAAANNYNTLSVITSTDKDGLAIVYTPSPTGTNGSALNFWSAHNTGINKAASIQSVVTSGANNGFTAMTFSTANAGTLNENMRIDYAGRVIKPNQPMFTAYGDAGGVGMGTTTVTLQYNTVVKHVGACYDGTSTFTAPIAGTYYFSASFLNYPYAATGYQTFYFSVNGYTYSGSNPMCRFTPGSQVSMSIDGLIYLNANDTVRVRVDPNNGGYYLNSGHAHFAGILIG